MRTTLKFLVIILAPFFAIAPAYAQSQLASAVSQLVWDPDFTWLQSETVASALVRDNENAAHLTSEDITALNQVWSLELGQKQAAASPPNTPFVNSVVQSPLSQALTTYKAQSGGVISDIIVLNYRGMSVAMTATTARFWQGNSANFRNAYTHGSIHTSKPRLNKKTGHHQVIVSMPIIHPLNMEIIGAAMLVLNADILVPGFTAPIEVQTL